MNYEHFMKKALEQAQIALAAGEFPVGCVLVYKGRILANAFRIGTSTGHGNEVDHAEMVALRRLVNLKENVDIRQVTMFCTMEPCLMCLGALVLSGLGEVVYAYEDVMGGGTSCNLTGLTPLYRDRKISIVPHILRQESLELFKAFFQNPENSYWEGSLLAEYTLKQP